MAAKRFLSLFKSSNKREKENNDPLLSDNQYHISNGQRRSRRVNFQSANSSKRRSCATELNNDDDDSSEVTLTATEASRQQHPNKKMPPNPYLVITEPKRNHGPRSCPGGGGQHFFDFDSLDNDDVSGANGGILDRSLEARSEYISTQPHRRSSRRRVIPSDVKTSSTQSSHPPFSEIGNGKGQIGRHQENTISFGTASRYKNTWTSNDFNNCGIERGKNQWFIQLREQQKELNELGMAYREERTRRKAIQRDLRKEQENKERLMMETFRLQSIIGVLLHQQQSKTITGNSNIQNGIDLNTLMGAAGIMQPNNLYSSWTGNTPSSSSAAAPSVNSQTLHQPTSSAIPNSWTPCRAAASFDFIGFQQQLPQQPPPSLLLPPSVNLFGNGGGSGECLGAPVLSSSSLMSQQTKQQNANRQQQNSEDEVKVYRTGQHNTDSFSGSSRLTAGDLTELERDKNDLLSDVSSKECFSPESPEIERGGTTTLHGLSFSADDCQHLFTINRRRNEEGQIERDVSVPTLFPDSELPLRDDGYSTSETNISASGIANSECTEGSALSHLLGHGNANISKIRRRSKSTGQIASMF